MDRGSKDRLGALLNKLEALSVLTETMSQRVELDVYPVFEQSLKQAAGALGAPAGCLHLADSEGHTLRLVEGVGLQPVQARAWQNLDVAGSAPPALAHRRNQVVSMNLNGSPEGWAISAPVRGFDTPLGIITLLWTEGQEPGLEADRDQFLLMVGHLTGLAVEHAGLVSSLVDSLNELRALKDQEVARGAELAELNRQLKDANQRLAELSITDGLTGLFNRRHLENRLAEEIERSRRQGHPVTLLMADLDHFKRINDELGHQAGDEALQKFALWLRESVRATDMVSRYGGEEFVVVLVDCAEATGLKVAEKIRRHTAEHSAKEPFSSLGGFTVSIGGAELAKGMDAQRLLAAADQALYRAKQRGRNRVELAGWGDDGSPGEGSSPPAGGK